MHAAQESFDPDAHVRGTPEPTAPWPVDLIHLRRYTMGDKQLEAEVLDLFAGELPKTVAALKRAATEEAWKMAAHTLKGSARAVGAWRLARAATVAERNAEAVSGDAYIDSLKAAA